MKESQTERIMNTANKTSEKIVEGKLTDEELAALQASAAVIKKTFAQLATSRE